MRDDDRRPSATAIIATKDRPELLDAAVRSIADALGPDDELIVAEAGDSGAAAALAAIRDVRTVHLPLARGGKCYQLNRAVERAANEVLVFTDDDACVDRGWIDAMARPFADPALGVAFGPVKGLTRHGPAAPDHESDGAPPPVGAAPVTTWTYANGVAMAARRRAVYEAGGFDERLGPGAPAAGEDHDLLIRVWERGWAAAIVDAPAVSHTPWRTAEETVDNLLVYERGGGAFVGAALRRHPLRWQKLALLRAHYQYRLLRESPLGRAALRSFFGGVAYGLRLGDRQWLDPSVLDG